MYAHGHVYTFMCRNLCVFVPVCVVCICESLYICMCYVYVCMHMCCLVSDKNYACFLLKTIFSWIVHIYQSLFVGRSVPWGQEGPWFPLYLELSLGNSKNTLNCLCYKLRWLPIFYLEILFHMGASVSRKQPGELCLQRPPFCLGYLRSFRVDPMAWRRHGLAVEKPFATMFNTPLSYFSLPASCWINVLELNVRTMEWSFRTRHPTATRHCWNRDMSRCGGRESWWGGVGGEQILWR